MIEQAKCHVCGELASRNSRGQFLAHTTRGKAEATGEHKWRMTKPDSNGAFHSIIENVMRITEQAEPCTGATKGARP